MEETNVISDSNLIIYELPLNDAVRIALRLENLFTQFQKTVSATSALTSKNAMNALLKVLEVTDRPDLKSKLSQTLTQYSHALTQLRNNPKIDAARLQKTLKMLETLGQYLHTQHTRIGEALRQNEFLSQIRSNLTNPGGVCDYRLPAYILWQNKSSNEKSKDLKQWMEVFQPLRDITETILELTRDSTPFEPASTDNGFFSQPLNPMMPCHLVRVALSPKVNLYPEFSAGKHRVTIRFLTPSYFGTGKPAASQQAISFQLACCKI
jgi:cell division protein ZapD